MNEFYHFADLEGDRPTLYIEGYISPGEPWCDAFCRNFCAPSSFRDALKSCEGKQLTVVIDSEGGDVAAGVAMYESLRAHKGDVQVKIYRAYSCASLICLGVDRDKRSISAGGSVLIHNPSAEMNGDWRDMESAAAFLKSIRDAAVGIYTERLGVTEEAVIALMDKETVWSGQAAVDAGWASGLIGDEEAIAENNRKLKASMAVSMAATENMIRAALERADEDKERAEILRLLDGSN